jgi:(E)-4-hydroxy-3-methylbut-2-enyl-diphosphate synthase
LWILLSEWIGDTIRVSLSGDPIPEIWVAKEILWTFWLYKKPDLISCPTCGRLQYNMVSIVEEIDNFLQTLNWTNIKVAIMWCAVNWPWEAKDADIWVAWWVWEALLFKKWKIIRKIPQDEIVSVLRSEILGML